MFTTTVSRILLFLYANPLGSNAAAFLASINTKAYTAQALPDFTDLALLHCLNEVEIICTASNTSYCGYTFCQLIEVRLIS